MFQNQVGEVVETTGIGREHPQRSRLVVPINLATAFRAGLGAEANQYAVRHGMADDVRAMSDGATAAIVNLASYLICGPVVLRGPAVRPALRICASDTSIMVANALKLVTRGCAARQRSGCRSEPRFLRRFRCSPVLPRPRDQRLWHQHESWRQQAKVRPASIARRWTGPVSPCLISAKNSTGRAGSSLRGSHPVQAMLRTISAIQLRLHFSSWKHLRSSRALSASCPSILLTSFRQRYSQPMRRSGWHGRKRIPHCY